MLRSQRTAGPPRRHGFTLIEILIVVAILVTLIALLLPAVLRALGLGQQVQNISQISQIGNAIGVAKEQLKLPQLPPGPFNFKPFYATTDPELVYLTKVWPQVQWTSTTAGPTTGPGSNWPTTAIALDSNQTLLFFLTGGAITNFSGFSTNPTNPFTLPSVGEVRRGPFLQMSTKYFVSNPTNFTSTFSTSQSGSVQSSPNTTILPNGQSLQWWIVDPYGMPYAYFAAINGQNNAYFAPGSLTPSTTILQSYQVMYTGLHGGPPTGPPILYPYVQTSGSLNFFNGNGFQIISSGKDMIFGGPATATNTPNSLPPLTSYGYDDVSNFSKTVLGGGIN